ncbi:MAG TPA: hypothetical protein VFB67_01735 [Candidatus Polarisedimenticolaceae bacterium]|nr:hypothetical protein [Candidatus Polarisedimenticolaceae bacterium]
MRAVLLFVLAGLAIACRREPTISDTGYAGTWARGTERLRSIVAIKKDDGGYRFRWSQVSKDERWRLRCDWEGRCEEFFAGKPIARYSFETYVDPATGHLMVRSARTGATRHGDDHTDLDELVVEPGGRRLTAYTIEKNGATFVRGGGPTRLFEKVSDAVE